VSRVQDYQRGFRRGRGCEAGGTQFVFRVVRILDRYVRAPSEEIVPQRVGWTERIDFHPWTEPQTQNMDPLPIQRFPDGRHPGELPARLVIVDFTRRLRNPLRQSDPPGSPSEEVRVDRRAMAADPYARQQEIGLAIAILRSANPLEVDTGDFAETSELVRERDVHISIEHAHQFRHFGRFDGAHVIHRRTKIVSVEGHGLDA